MTKQESHALWENSKGILKEHVEQLKNSEPEVITACSGDFGDLTKASDEYKRKLHELWVTAYKDVDIDSLLKSKEQLQYAQSQNHRTYKKRR